MTPRSLAAIAALVTVGLTAATLHSVSGQGPRGDVPFAVAADAADRA